MRPLVYLVLIVSLLWGASEAQTCNVDDLLAQALAAAPSNYLPRPGICGIMRPEPRAYQQQSNRNGTVLSFSNIRNQLNAPFCLAMIVNPMNEPTMFYIYQNTLTPVGLLTINSDNILFTLNGNSANLFGNFTGFNQIQLCANGTHMNLYIGCRFSMSVAFSAPGVSENAVLPSSHHCLPVILSLMDLFNSCIYPAAPVFLYKAKSMPSAPHSLLTALYLTCLSKMCSISSHFQPRQHLLLVEQLSKGKKARKGKMETSYSDHLEQWGHLVLMEERYGELRGLLYELSLVKVKVV